VYYFDLIYEENNLIMPIIANPFVEKLVIACKLQVMPFVNIFGIEKSPKEVAFEEHK
jgi:hypothetical protein